MNVSWTHCSDNSVPAWLVFLPQVFFSFHNIFIVCHHEYPQSNAVLTLCDQGVQMTISGLTVNKTVLWMDYSIALINPFVEGIQAPTYVFDLAICGVCIQSFFCKKSLIFYTEFNISFVSMGIEKLPVVTIAFQLQPRIIFLPACFDP